MNKLEIVSRLEEIKYEAEHIEAERVELNKTLIEEMKTKEELIGEFIAKKITVVKYKPTMEQAEGVGAVIQEPKIDMKKIKSLADAGVKFPKEEFTYLKIARAE